MSQLGYNTNQTNSTPFITLSASAATAKKADALISVRCDVFPCSAHATGTRKQLQLSGWGIYDREEFCPTHESEI